MDIVDAAMAPLSGITSQPNLNALVETLSLAAARHRPGVRPAASRGRLLGSGPSLLRPLRERPAAPPSADVYRHEMPGGQYTNLYQQAQALGLAIALARDVCKMYAEVNRLFGDIVKVTPTSKVVGDMALFMVGNNLTPADVRTASGHLAFPEIGGRILRGRLGQPPGGFPPALQKRILGKPQADAGRPGASLPAADFPAARTRARNASSKRKVRRPGSRLVPALSARFTQFAGIRRSIPTRACCPRRSSSTAWSRARKSSVEIEPGKTLIIKFLTVGDPHPDGTRQVFFELNGQPREVLVAGPRLGAAGPGPPQGGPGNADHVGSPMPGLVVRVTVAPGEEVEKDQKLFTLEAMKMETTVYAERKGRVAQVLVQPGTLVEAGDLMLRYE